MRDSTTLPVSGFGAGGARGGVATAGHVGMDLCWRRSDDNSRGGRGVVWICIPVPLNRRLVHMARGISVKMPRAFHIRMEDSHYWARKPRSTAEIEKLFEQVHRIWRRNPPCNAEDNLRAGLVVIEAWFGGY